MAVNKIILYPGDKLLPTPDGEAAGLKSMEMYEFLCFGIDDNWIKVKSNKHPKERYYPRSFFVRH